MNEFKLIALKESMHIDMAKLSNIGKRFGDLQSFGKIVHAVKTFTTKYEGNLTKIEKNYKTLAFLMDEFFIKVDNLAEELGTDILDDMLETLENLRATADRYYTTSTKKLHLGDRDAKF